MTLFEIKKRDLINSQNIKYSTKYIIKIFGIKISYKVRISEELQRIEHLENLLLSSLKHAHSKGFAGGGVPFKCS